MGKGLLLCMAACSLLAAGPGRTEPPTPSRPLAERIGHSDPAKYRHLSAVHDGAGTMDFAPILGADALGPNLIFVHRGVIAPHSGIGQHVHSRCEEMFVILDGEAQFTIDGRTALLKGPAGVPDRMGYAHALYNPTDRPVQWLNVNVGMTKVYDAFNLGDPHTGAQLDPIPQFITMRLDRALLKPVARMDGGRGEVEYRRALEPVIFSTPWAYVDHLLIPPGSSVGPRAQPDVAEVYYVLSGEGRAEVAGESAALHPGDALPVELGQARALSAAGGAPLELMVIGVARDMTAKAALMARPPSPKS